MTQANTHIQNRSSTISDVIVGALTAAMIVLSGFLSLVQFAAAVV